LNFRHKKTTILTARCELVGLFMALELDLA